MEPNLLQVRFKHKFYYNYRDSKSNIISEFLGDVYSFNDSSNFRVECDLIADAEKTKLSAGDNLKKFPYFIFALHRDCTSNMINFVDSLKEKSKCVLIKINNKDGTEGLFVPMEDTDRLKIPSNCGNNGGFRCYILKQQAVLKQQDGSAIGTKRGRDQEVSENHYNELRRVRDERHQSQIFHLRNLNNWCKVALIDEGLSMLIPQRHTTRNDVKLLDLGCGKGGDLAKWLKCSRGVRDYIGVDIAQNSLNDFVERVRGCSASDQEKVSKLICADMGSDSLLSSELDTFVLRSSQRGVSGANPSQKWEKKVPLSMDDFNSFDIISCQFALHYMFETYERADHFFGEVNKLLRPGGIFLASTMDCRVVAHLAARSLCGPVALSAPTTTSASAGPKHIEIRNELSRLLVRMQFDEANWSRLLLGSASTSDAMGALHLEDDGDDIYRDAYGIRYTFTLLDKAGDVNANAVGGDLSDSGNVDDENSLSAVNAPEWLVPLGEPLQRLVEKHGLRIDKCANFHEFVADIMGKEKDGKLSRLMDKMEVFNYKGTVTQAEWQVAR